MPHKASRTDRQTDRQSENNIPGSGDKYITDSDQMRLYALTAVQIPSTVPA